jgi:hypothetical protein
MLPQALHNICVNDLSCARGKPLLQILVEILHKTCSNKYPGSRAGSCPCTQSVVPLLLQQITS